MKKNIGNKQGYSVIISLLLIGFLLVLSTGIFGLMINELKGSRAVGDYIKAYAGAESSQELALLEIKNKSFALSKKIANTLNNESIILSDNPLDKSKFKARKDVLISYNIDGKANTFSGTVNGLEYHILPLFYVDENNNDHKVKNINFLINEGTKSNLVWNVVGDNNGISGVGQNLSGIEKKYSGGIFNSQNKNIDTFLGENNSNFLILFNSSRTESISYTIETTDRNEYFTKPVVDIISTGEVGIYKQNLKTTINNAEYLDFLKYSIYSN